MAVTRAAALPELAASSYVRSTLHAETCAWVEKNCYIDIWIEVLHALGLDPVAMLPFTLGVDFEDDQWTFFKPPHGELWDLYGVDVQELNVWRPLLDTTLAHVAAKKLVSTEADAFWLPDTAGTDYRAQHTKTTIVIASLDTEAKRMGYFHNASYHELEGEDFDRLFRVGVPHDPSYMPFFAETIRFDRKVVRAASDLRTRSRALLRAHAARRPAKNPIARFAAHFPEDLAWVQREGLAFYHAWAFANLRQVGAAFELAATNLRWQEDPALAPAAEAFASISTTAKALILKVARAVNGKKPLDLSATFAEMASAWDRGFEILDRELGVTRP